MASMKLLLMPMVAIGCSIGLSGCVAKTMLDVVTAPVKIVSRTVDLATVSQSERDERRGREIRQREAKLATLDRDWAIANAECEGGNRTSCNVRDDLATEMDELMPSIPVEPTPY